MSSRQLYQSPRDVEQVKEELRAHRGAQWDPEIIDLVLGLIEWGELILRIDGLSVTELTAEASSGHGVAVLLVEAEDDQARLVSDALTQELDGAVVARATSVAEAAELQNGFAWSIAVVAHELPDGSGMQVLDALRAASPALPVVMLTADDADATAQAFRHGASDYAVKGDSYDALAARVRGLVAA